MLFEWFIDIQYGVTWFVEAGQQLVNDDEQFHCVVSTGECGGELADVVFLGAKLVHHLGPEGF